MPVHEPQDTGPRDPRKRLRFLSCLVVVVVAVIAGAGWWVVAPRPTMAIEQSPAVLRAGDRAKVIVRTDFMRVCELVVLRKGKPETASSIEVADRSSITWTWRVPRDAAPATGEVRVLCRESTDHGDGSSSKTKSRTLRVIGSSKGTKRRFVDDGIAATVGRRPGPRIAQLIPAIAAAVGLLVTIGGLFLVVEGLALTAEQIRSGNDQATADRTASLFERFRELEFTLLWSRAGHNFLKATTLDACMERIKVFEEVPYGASRLKLGTIPKGNEDHKHAMYAEVILAANIHEEIGVLFNKHIVDQEQVIRHFGTELVGNFAIAWWYVHWARENRVLRPLYLDEKPPDRECETYAEWERMVREIISTRDDLAKKMTSCEPGQVWVICLPSQWPAADWQGWKAVSKELSCSVDDLPELERALRIDRDAPPDHVRTRRVICVTSWSPHDEYAARLQDVASTLDAYTELAELEELAEGLAYPKKT